MGQGSAGKVARRHRALHCDFDRRRDEFGIGGDASFSLNSFLDVNASHQLDWLGLGNIVWNIYK